MIIKVSDIDKISLKGKTIAFPTDTVYGIGAMITDDEAIHKIYELKQRDYSKPLAVLVGDISQIKGLVKNYSLVDKASKFWPGAITFIFEKDKVSDLVSKYNTIGIRIPDSKLARELLMKTGPMAVTSVNLAGKPSATTYEEVLNFDIDYILKDSINGSNIASTVVDLSNNKILREGSVKLSELVAVFPDLK